MIKAYKHFNIEYYSTLTVQSNNVAKNGDYTSYQYKFKKMLMFIVMRTKLSRDDRIGVCYTKYK